MPKKKSKLAKNQNFQKVKFKVGKKLPKGQNYTDASFKSRPIIIKEQLKGDSTEVSTKKKLTFKDLMTQCNHYNGSIRYEATLGLRELLSAHPQQIFNNLSSLLKRIGEMTMDNETIIRKSVSTILSIIFSSTNAEIISPFFPMLSSYICCAMTHIHDDIRQDSLLFIDVSLEFCPSLLISDDSKILTNFVDMISSKCSLEAGKSFGSTNTSTRTLSVNPDASITGHKWRSEVLHRLHKFLKALINKHHSQVSQPAIQSGANTSFNNKCSPIYSVTSTKNCQNSFPLYTSHDFSTSFNLGSFQTIGKAKDSFSPTFSILDFSEVLIPLLFDTWVESRPELAKQKSSDLTRCFTSGSLLDYDSLCSSYNITQIMNSLLQVLSISSKSSLSSIEKKYFPAIKRHFLQGFPFCLIQRPSKKAKLSSNENITVQALNLTICNLVSFFPSCENEINRILAYQLSFLQQETLIWEDLPVSLDVIQRIAESLVDTNLDKLNEILASYFKILSSGNCPSKYCLMVLHIFDQLVIQSFVSSIKRISSYHLLLNALPSLFFNCSTTNMKIQHKILAMIKTSASQGNTHTIQTISKNITKFIGSLSRYTEEVQVSIVHLLFHIPQLTEVEYNSCKSLFTSNQFSLNLLSTLLNVLYARFTKAESDNNQLNLLCDFYGSILVIQGNTFLWETVNFEKFEKKQTLVKIISVHTNQLNLKDQISSILKRSLQSSLKELDLCYTAIYLSWMHQTEFDPILVNATIKMLLFSQQSIEMSSTDQQVWYNQCLQLRNTLWKCIITILVESSLVLPKVLNEVNNSIVTQDRTQCIHHINLLYQILDEQLLEKQCKSNKELFFKVADTVSSTKTEVIKTVC